MQKFFVLTLLLAGALTAAEPKGVVATIATDNYITTADMQARIETFPSQYREFYSSPDGKKKILDMLIEEKLLAAAARTGGYATNPEVLRTLESIKAEVMTNQYVKDEISKLTVSDSEISAHYNASKEKYTLPEAVRASHILVDTEAEAQALLQELKGGKDFAAAAREKSIDTGSAQRGGDLDFFTRGQMVEPFEKVAFALQSGELSKAPVQTQFGWHIIKVTERRAAKQQTLAEVKADIRSELLLQKQRNKVNSLLEAAKQKYPVKTNPDNLQ
ncbi:MAG: peptidylprolyl isomerase [Candidatus Margulisbacteria bacterium]|jgi:peptidyl-prolyl cis-trans isomerase C|nr:peptidylprolyl isomerase [Candidatus Margulisiibacteriota bacterium]